MIQSKVSIIVPVYNVELYLRQCLDSVIHQTLAEIEIICINDGSTDNSLNILREYAALDNRIVIIDKENGGQGLARNIAIQKATGEYLGFVDGDDWIDNNMFLYLYESAKRFKADVTICEFQHFDEKKGIIPQTEWLKLPIDKRFDHRSFRWKDINENGFQINSGAVNKIYKKDYILNNNIEFTQSLYYEDVLFVFISLIKAEKISLVRKPLYFYRHSRSGSTSFDKGKKQFDIFTILGLLQNAIQDLPVFDLLKIQLQKYKLKQYFYHCIDISNKYKKEFWARIKSEFYAMDKETRKALWIFNLLIRMGMKNGLFLYKRLKYISILKISMTNIFRKHNF